MRSTLLWGQCFLKAENHCSHLLTQAVYFYRKIGRATKYFTHPLCLFYSELSICVNQRGKEVVTENLVGSDISICDLTWCFYFPECLEYLFQTYRNFLWLEVWSVSCSVVSDSVWPHGLKAHQVPLPMEFTRREYWSGFHFLLQQST